MDLPLRIVGDVHGAPAALARAVRTSDRHIILLGDLIDGGTDNASVLRRAVRLLDRGQATLIRSNHDDKLYRALIGRQVKAGPDLQRTIQQIEAARDAAHLKSSFVRIYERARDWLYVPPYFMAHGAFHPDMLIAQGLDQIGDRKQRDFLRWLSLFAEGRANPDGGLPIRTYGWLDTIPADLTVIVGHDIRSRRSPVFEHNAQGGRAVFLDTGCGKGGRLTWMDLPDETFGQFVPRTISA
ncbi:MAG: metallophosphoesterase [Pseudomonadota bacterium]